MWVEIYKWCKKLKAFGVGYSYDLLKAGISGTKGANCVFTNTLVLWKDPLYIEIQVGVIFHVLHRSNTLYPDLYFKETPTFMWYIMSSLLSLLLYWASATFLYIRLEKCENQHYESKSDHFYPDPCSNLFFDLFGQWSPVKNGEATVGGERHGHLLVEGGEVGVGLLVAQLGHPDHALLVAGEEKSGISCRRKSIACGELFAKLTFGDLMQQESFSRINFL